MAAMQVFVVFVVFFFSLFYHFTFCCSFLRCLFFYFDFVSGHAPGRLLSIANRMNVFRYHFLFIQVFTCILLLKNNGVSSRNVGHIQY